MLEAIFDIQDLEYLTRVLLAGFCGFVIGLERQKRTKNAGVRTHCMIGMSTALLIVVSKYGFLDVALANGMNVDISRLAASIIGGVGIISGGLIFIGKQGTASGITTTTGILMTMAIGMSIGSGMRMLGIYSTIVVIVVQAVLHTKLGIVSDPIRAVVTLKLDNNEDDWIQKIEKDGILINSVNWKHTSGNQYKVTLNMRFPKKMTRREAADLITEYKKVESFEIIG